MIKMYFNWNWRLISILKQAKVIHPNAAIQIVSLNMPDPQTKVLGINRMQMAIGLISFGYCSAKVLNMAHTPVNDIAANNTEVGRYELNPNNPKTAVILLTK